MHLLHRREISQKSRCPIDYELFRKRKGIAYSTIRNEIASINACMTFLHEHTEALSDISAFKVPKIQSRKYDDSGEEIRRQTFTNEEWQTFYVAMRSYCAKKNNSSVEEYYEKQLARHFLLVMANSGFRNGELRQLKWKNVTVERHVDIRAALRCTWARFWNARPSPRCPGRGRIA